VSNALAAATAARLLDVPAATIAAGLSSAENVSGRFEPVEAGQPFRVVVDYAHTPDGLEQLLRAAREVTEARVIVVFGCGGDRDRTKRPAMGEVATTLADRVVVTSDNPRSEDPLRIIYEVLAGVADRGAVVVEPDRRQAIELALEEAAPGDTVVIAGKGHETTQTVGDEVVPFDDRAVARRGLERLRGTKAGW
jgi:UDP-N-acetylmuramoyl-L-alanyl-D-glutamate--2,6-diaminopimelate ligase